MLSKDRPIRNEELKLNASPELNKENIQKYNFDKTRPIRDEELKMYYPEEFSRKRRPIRDDELEPYVPPEDNRENKQNRSVPKKRRQHSPTHMMIKNATKPKIIVYYEILKSNNPKN